MRTTALQGSILDTFGSAESILSKRWDFNVNREPSILDFLSNEGNTVGTVWRGHPRLRKTYPYGTAFLEDGTSVQTIKMQNMRNTASPKVHLERGRTYVSLGFVDFQQLMEAELTGFAEDGPVDWHGYEMNPAAVAKSKLVLAMLTEGVPVDQILQIWFSSCISPEAAKSLALFSEKLRLSEKNKDVRDLLNWWSKATIKEETSLKEWNLGRGNAAFTNIPLLLKKRDRVEYARYILTGQIFLSGAKKVTGNPTFLSPPNSDVHYYRASDESIYSAVDLVGEFNYEGSLLASIENKFISNLNNLRKHVKENQIKITLSVANISADNDAVLSEIKRLEPALIDWSNIPDYFTIPDFFSVARRCSTEKTKHSFHMMNWMHIVYGSNLADYVPFRENYGSKDFRLHGFFKDSRGTLQKLAEELRNELVARAEHQTSSPITQDPRVVVSGMNIMDVSDAAFSFRFCDTYMNFLFENLQVTSKKWQNAEMSVFDTVNSTVYVSFQF